ncbi:MAG: MerR family transcriptional regulator [Chthoniobacterales bacterium]
MEYHIQAVVRRTGISAHVLRVWEKRYQAVVPERTETKRRVYSESDIRRLQLLREATLLGHSISSVAKLTTDKLETLIAQSGQILAEKKAGTSTGAKAGGSPIVQACIAAVKGFDAEALNTQLHRATVESGFNGLLRHVIAPLTQELGDLWGAGQLKIAHEHFATAAIRAFLLNPARQYAGATSNSTVVVATPQGQLHELGAVMAASLAAEQGWHSIYLGPSLPAAEIAGVALQNRARAVVLSIIYPEDDPNIERELHDLRHLLPANVHILVCGRAADRYAAAIEAINAVAIRDLAHFQTELAKIRARRI